MKQLKTKTETDPMEQAYKLIDGVPAQDAVSNAAKGIKPKTDFAQQEDEHTAMVARMRGKNDDADGADSEDKSDALDDIQDAYAKLFESLAVILRQ